MGCGDSKPSEPPISKSSFLEGNPEDKKDLLIVEHGKLRIPAAVCKMQGWRSYQEDMAVAISSLNGASDYLLCGVFDGHSGKTCSSHAASTIFPTIVGTSAWREGNVEKALIDGFLTVDENLRKANAKDGTTAICAVVGLEKVWVANCGDSRGVLCRDGVFVPLSVDHKPSNVEEAERIRRAGGYVDTFDPLVPRVMAPNCYMAMATSRTLGDFHFKTDKKRPSDEQIVSPKPSIIQLDRHAMDQFIILATDGVWDVMSNQDVCNFLMEASVLPPDTSGISHEHDENRSPEENGNSSKQGHDVGDLAKGLLAHCLTKGTMDNCSVIIVDLRNSGIKANVSCDADTPISSFATHTRQGRAALEDDSSSSLSHM